MLTRVSGFQRAVRSTAKYVRGQHTTASRTSSTLRHVLTGTVAAGATAAALAATQTQTAESQGTVFDMLNGISARLSTIEEALGINFQADLEKVAAIKVSHPGNRAIKYFDMNYFNSLSVEKKKQMIKIAK